MNGLPEGVAERVHLAPHTSLRVGGPAHFFARARSSLDVAPLLRWAARSGIPARVVGGGSNLLVADAGADGLVIKAATTHFEVVERDGSPVLVADAGVRFASVARRLSKQGYGGLEWAANVPGSVGGAVVNNAGAFGGDTASHVLAVAIVDASGVERRLSGDDMGYGYRTSVLKRRELPGPVGVLQVELRLERMDARESQRILAELQARRTLSQPRQLSAGSVFANPAGDYSGRLIEATGLKGLRIGGAQVSTQHANFIVNIGKATARDVFNLVTTMQQRVLAETGVWLQPEIELFGRWSDEELALVTQDVTKAEQ